MTVAEKLPVYMLKDGEYYGSERRNGTVPTGSRDMTEWK